MHKWLQKSKKENVFRAVLVWQLTLKLMPVKHVLKTLFQRLARIYLEHRAGTAVLWYRSSGINVLNQNKIQSIPSSVFNNNSLLAARSVSAPSSATGQLRETSAGLVWTWANPSMLHSSSTTNTVPKDGPFLHTHQLASRVLTKRKPGPVRTIFAKMVEADLLGLNLMPQFKLCWSPSTWWPQQGSFGLEPGRMWGLVLPAGRLENTSGQTTLHWTWTIAIGQMDIHCQV